jgi:histone-lysine N-methyltransferase SETMAR
VERVLQILEEDRRMTCEEIAHTAGISPTSAYRIVTERFHKRRIAARWVPHDLSEEQKCGRLEIAKLLHRFREEGNEFLQKVVAIDESWIRNFEPELKSQSSEWRGQGSPRPKKFKRAQSNVKQMMKSRKIRKRHRQVSKSFPSCVCPLDIYTDTNVIPINRRSHGFRRIELN